MEVLKGGKLTSTSFIFILVYLRLLGLFKVKKPKKRFCKCFQVYRKL